MTKTIDEIMATMPPILQDSFARFNDVATVKPKQTVTNRGALAAIDVDEVYGERPTASPQVPYTGRITPSIYCAKGDALSIWNTDSGVEVVLRDGNGHNHFGRLTAALLAEGRFSAAADEEEKAFRSLVFDTVVGPDRQAFDVQVGPDRMVTNPNGDRNYSHRATCLWTNRDRTGAPHSRAFLVVTWSSSKTGFHFPMDALLFDGGVTRIFQLQREAAGGNRPQWKGRAS